MAAGILCWCAGMYIGRATTPVKVEEKIVKEVETVTEIKFAYVDRVVETEVYVKDEKKNVRTEEREVIRPDGTIERERIQTSETETKVAEQQTRQRETQAQETTRTEEHRTEVAERKIEAAPDWRVSLMAGIGPRNNLLPQPPPPFMVGVGVQHRIIGPIHGGVWAFTNGSIGLSVGAEF